MCTSAAVVPSPEPPTLGIQGMSRSPLSVAPTGKDTNRVQGSESESKSGYASLFHGRKIKCYVEPANGLSGKNQKG